MEDYDLSIEKNTPAENELEALLEAARRATWDALHGPVHLRSGRFRPGQDPPSAAAANSNGTVSDEAAQQGDSADDDPRPDGSV
jgi:hypothetical protein